MTINEEILIEPKKNYKDAISAFTEIDATQKIEEVERQLSRINS